jgi:hypothetical protein
MSAPGFPANDAARKEGGTVFVRYCCLLMDKVFLAITYVSVVVLVSAFALATPKVGANKPSDGTVLVHAIEH